MRPLEFVLWLNGATGMLGDEVPSPEQWRIIRECLANTIGPIVAAKLLDKADELSEQSKLESERMKIYQQMLSIKQQTLSNQIPRGYAGLNPTLGGYVDDLATIGYATTTASSTSRS